MSNIKDFIGSSGSSVSGGYAIAKKENYDTNKFLLGDQSDLDIILSNNVYFKKSTGSTARFYTYCCAL